MLCSEKHRLIEDYRGTVQVYTESVEAIKCSAGAASFNSLHDASRHALASCEAALLALDLHIDDHKCAIKRRI